MPHTNWAKRSASVCRRPKGWSTLLLLEDEILKEDTGRRERRKRIDWLFRLSPLVTRVSFTQPFSIPASLYNRNSFQIAFAGKKKLVLIMPLFYGSVIVWICKDLRSIGYTILAIASANENWSILVLFNDISTVKVTQPLLVGCLWTINKSEAVLKVFSVLLSRLISNVDDFNRESSMWTSLNRSATDQKICIVQIMEKNGV